MRYTEYHAGKAVIRDKNKLSAAMEKLARYEDAEDVVKELEDLKMSYFLTLANTGDVDKDCAYLNTANAIDKAIEIVKRGKK